MAAPDEPTDLAPAARRGRPTADPAPDPAVPLTDAVGEVLERLAGLERLLAQQQEAISALRADVARLAEGPRRGPFGRR